MNLVYKYRIWEDFYHKRCITNNEIFYSSVDKLNDPKELKGIFRYDLLKDNEIVDHFIKIIKEKESYLTEDKILAKAKEWFEEDKKKNFVKLKQLGKDLVKNFRKKIGIFSLSLSSTNHHQWVNYANKYKGFCIGYDFELLQKTMGGFGGTISYIPELPKIIPTINNDPIDLFRLCLSKLDSWSGEDETRFAKLNFVNRKWSIKSNIIKEIIFGSDISINSKNEILTYAKRKYKDCRFYVTNKPENGVNYCTLKPISI